MIKSVYQIDSESNDFGLLNIYCIYRLALSAILSLLYLPDFAMQILGSTNGKLFFITSIIYFSVTLSSYLFLLKKRDFDLSLKYLIFLSDLVALIYLAHLSGGLSGGLGYLTLIPIAAGSIVLTSQLTLLLAAKATLGLLTLTFVRFQNEQASFSEFFNAGIAGVLFFSTAALFLFLSKKLAVTQSLAIQNATEALESQLLNQKIVSRMRTGIIVIDPNKRIKLINGAAIQLIGKPSNQSVLAAGQSLHSLPELAKQLAKWKAYPWLRTPSFQEQFSPNELQANFAKISDEDDSQTIIFIEDVRALSQHAQQLKNSSLGRLTGSIAHEIKNPLGAISHAAQLLNEAQLKETDLELVDIINRHCDRVNQIINRISGLSSQNAPKLQKVLLQQWLLKFQSDFLISQQDLCDIHIEHLSGEFKVTFDPLHLSQVLTNMVDNGLRYSEEKMGQRTITLITGLDTNGLPYIDVRDQGDGVSSHIQQQIFEPFYTTRHAGSGLGLYLSRELCTANFATLNYLDQDNGGPCFRIGFSHPEQILPRKA